jgi:uncharacterized protein DUF3108
MNRHIGTFLLAVLAFGALAGAAPAPLGAQANALTSTTASTATSATGPRDEEFRYRWELGNLMGSVAGIFLPRRGEGALTFKSEDGNLRSELVITSPGHAGEYWRYGAVIDPRRLKPIRAWSSYLWRGKAKSKSEELGPQGVMDVVSGIYSIRQDPPERPRRMEIWSDGRIYPVIVRPLGIENRKLPQGTVRARHFSIRGVDQPGVKRWKGKLDIWLTPDEWATPVEILISRNLADVRLQLQPPPATPSPGAR